jgi:hypothetical protein
MGLMGYNELRGLGSQIVSSDGSALDNIRYERDMACDEANSTRTSPTGPGTEACQGADTKYAIYQEEFARANANAEPAPAPAAQESMGDRMARLTDMLFGKEVVTKEVMVPAPAPAPPPPPPAPAPKVEVVMPEQAKTALGAVLGAAALGGLAVFILSKNKK